ncbi:hypothetical protein SAMN06314019_1108 [Epsilonproteobacteria bacterium SCGC AD-311-C15]|nr:hypothetical protein SAMN06314019_1108 [Epsilonproteobacteria bacterium SCGC AD-311-C15]
MFYYTISLIFLFLLIMGAYNAILICILFIGFYELVAANKKYTYLKVYIEKFI